MNTHRVGLTTGIFFALLHLGWVALVATGSASQIISWLLRLHFITEHYTIQPFEASTAALLVGVAFVSGYLLGFIFTSIWNFVRP